jgi:hypothetical protein
MTVSLPSAPRHDHFISYAREDQQFVRQLNDALDSRKRRAWVDWQGIPPSVDWMHEVYAAIEGADCFVSVLSEVPQVNGLRRRPRINSRC